jgi:hypothetical protein
MIDLKNIVLIIDLYIWCPLSTEALDSLQDTAVAVGQRESVADKTKRVRRELFNKDEKKIAGVSIVNNSQLYLCNFLM